MRRRGKKTENGSWQTQPSQTKTGEYMVAVVEC